MNRTFSALALIAALTAAGAASAQVPSGGSGSPAKGNAPVKHAHTVNDGIARKGSNSFTEGQARAHIERAGYTGVTGLTKGRDGVWRGRAMKNGASVEVGMDFKGNVTEGGAMAASLSTPVRSSATTREATTADSTTPPPNPTATSRHGRYHRRHHRRHHHMQRCAHPGPNGVACSGVDRNRNSISDKEDRAIQRSR